MSSLGRRNSAIIHGRTAKHPGLWSGAEFFWNFSLGLGPDVRDLSGNGHDATITGGINSNQFFDDVSGIQQGLRCLRRTGTGGYIKLDDYAGFRPFRTGPWTFICRFSIASSADDRTIFAYRRPSGAFQLLVRTDASTPDIEVYHGTGAGAVISGGPQLVLDEAYTQVLVCNGLAAANDLRLLLYDKDGVIVQDALGSTNTDESPSTVYDWWIGAAFSDTNDPLVGTHCGLYAYSRDLAISECELFVEDWLAPFRPGIRRSTRVLPPAAPAGGVEIFRRRIEGY